MLDFNLKQNLMYTIKAAALRWTAMINVKRVFKVIIAVRGTFAEEDDPYGQSVRSDAHSNLSDPERACPYVRTFRSSQCEIWLLKKL